ncbi:hypothetical protein [Enterocloster sp.]|uniref:hypothetical protein n=1 Tax=Enterocloster sp. TaxID=2719315 RepID=UPI0039A27F23
MFIDEKIASMDRLRRENLRKELEERKADQDKKMLTIEEAMAGIQAGKLQMKESHYWNLTLISCPLRIFLLLSSKISMMLIRKMRKV